MEWVTGFFKAIELRRTFWLAAAILSAVLLYSPDDFLKKVKISALRNSLEAWIAGVFILSLLLLLKAVFDCVDSWREDAWPKYQMKRALKNLSRTEKVLVSHILFNGPDRSVQALSTPQVIDHLVRLSILGVNEFGRGLYITELAAEVLDKNPALISTK